MSSSNGAGATAGSSNGANGDRDTLQLIQDNLKSVHQQVVQIGTEHPKTVTTLSAINKIHEKTRESDKITSNNKQKLKNHYGTALEEAKQQEEMVRAALLKIYEIRALKNDRRIQAKQAGNPKEAVRRGTLMKMLQTSAALLPLWMGKQNERPPPLCGSVPADINYVAKIGDMVAALVKNADSGEENWILAEVVRFNSSVSKYELEDVDEEQKELLTLGKRHVVPLPVMRADPQTHAEALFPKNTLVLALYPQTTCFYKAIIVAQPKSHNDEYEVQFEDSTYSEGFSPSLKVAQRYVIPVKATNKTSK